LTKSFNTLADILGEADPPLLNPSLTREDKQKAGHYALIRTEAPLSNQQASFPNPNDKQRRYLYYKMEVNYRKPQAVVYSKTTKNTPAKRNHQNLIKTKSNPNNTHRLGLKLRNPFLTEVDLKHKAP